MTICCRCTRAFLCINHGPRIHEFLTEFQEDVLLNYDCMTLAEAPMVTPKIALKYIREGKGQEFSMMIQNETMCADCFFQDFFPTSSL